MPKTRFRNAETVFEVVSIAHLGFQDCTEKEFSNSILCQVKQLTLKKTNCLAIVVYGSSGEYIAEKKVVIFKSRQSVLPVAKL